jgi:hypothetical protein
MSKIPKNSILTRMKDDLYMLSGTDLVFLEEWGGLTRLHAPTRATVPFLSTTLFVSIQYFPLSISQARCFFRLKKAPVFWTKKNNFKFFTHISL